MTRKTSLKDATQMYAPLLHPVLVRAQGDEAAA
jgi:hypothetical protein